MDRIASVLLDFPPAGGLADNTQYHHAAQSHSAKVDKLSAQSDFKEHARKLLDVSGGSE